MPVKQSSCVVKFLCVQNFCDSVNFRPLSQKMNPRKDLCFDNFSKKPQRNERNCNSFVKINLHNFFSKSFHFPQYAHTFFEGLCKGALRISARINIEYRLIVLHN